MQRIDEQAPYASSLAQLAELFAQT